MPSPSPADPSSQPVRPVRSMRPRDRGGAWAAAVDAEPCRPCRPTPRRPSVEVSHTSDPAHGDVASNVALKLARPLRRPPMAIAEAIAAVLRSDAAGGPLAEVTVAAPGFLNLRLAPAVPGAAPSMRPASRCADSDGCVRSRRPRRLNVEFVSANPTGPLTVGNARGAFVGDLLCRVLEAGGHTSRASTTSTTRARRCGCWAPASPRDGWARSCRRRPTAATTWRRSRRSCRTTSGRGPGGRRRPRRRSSARGRRSASAPASRPAWSTSVSTSMSGRARRRSTTEGWVERAVERLADGGHIYELDGATWFRSTDVRRRQGPGDPTRQR